MYLKVMFVTLLGVIIGLLRVATLQLSPSENDIVRMSGQCGIVAGTIVSEVEIDSDVQKFYLCAKTFDHDGEVHEVSGKIRVAVPLFPSVTENDKVGLGGCISEITYFKSNGAFSILKGSYVVDRSSLSTTLEAIRKRVADVLEKNLWEPYSSLILGMVAGMTRNMPASFSDALRKTGTTHLIAISGYNVTLVSNSVIRLFLMFTNRRYATLIGMILIWGFAVFVGAGAPVIRAALMTTFSLLGVLVGRPALIHIGFIVSIALMLLWNPLYLVSISFQLSSLATAGLIYLSPILMTALSEIGKIPEFLRSTVAVGLSANLMTLPVIVYNFGTVSIVSLPINIAVAPVIELVTLGGIFMVLGGMIWRGVTVVIGFFLWFPLKYFVTAVEWGSSLRFASLETGSGNMLIFVLYVVIFGLVMSYGEVLD